MIESLINGQNMWFLLLAMIWILPWKGYALWTAARLKSKRWFIILLILNTFAILDIFYIFYIAKKNLNDIKKLPSSEI